MKRPRIFLGILGSAFLLISGIYLFLLDRVNYAYPGLGAGLFALAGISTIAFAINYKNRVLYSLTGALTVATLSGRAILSVINIFLINLNTKQAEDTAFQSVTSITLNICLILLYLYYWKNTAKSLAFDKVENE